MLTLMLLAACASTPLKDQVTTLDTSRPPESTSTDTTCAGSTSAGSTTTATPAGAVALGIVPGSVGESGGSDSDAGGLALNETVNDTVYVYRYGQSHGCACGAALRAWLFADEGRIELDWQNGPGNLDLDCLQTAELTGVPPGDWTVTESWGDLSTSFTVH